MAFYPLLSQGASAQYPIVRTRRWLAPRTETPGGYVARSIDSRGRVMRWELEYADLSDTEAQAIATLYEQSRGALLAFTFVDPLSNLLSTSEDLTAAVWSRSALLSVAAGGSGPLVGRRVFVVTNGSQGLGSISQAISVPTGYTYNFSCYMKSAVAVDVTLSIGAVSRVVQAGGAWARRFVVADISSGGPVAFGLALPSGAAIQVYGLQAEAQPAPSPYKPTAAAGGVYPQTRFVGNSLEIVVKGPNRNALRTVLETQLAE